MPYFNLACIVGHLGRDPEIKYTPSGSPVCTFSVATSKSWKKKDGSDDKKTTWHNIKAWGTLAERCATELAKGMAVCVNGELETEEWEDKNGGGKRSKTVIVAFSVVPLPKSEADVRRVIGHETTAPATAPAAAPNSEPAPAIPPAGDEIPF